MAKKKRKFIGKAILIVGLLVLCLAGVFAYLQKDNIEAVLFASRYSAQERKVKVTEKEAELLEKIAEEMPEMQIKPLTEEEENLLKNGEISPEDALQRIMGVTSPVDRGNPYKAEEKNETPAKDQNSRLQELLAKVYLMKASYSGQIDGLVSQAKQEYIAGKGKISKFTIGKKYIGMAGSLEAQCDGQMEAILAQIKEELQKTGGNLSLVDEIRAAYKSEKSAKKAALIEEYAS